MPAGESAQLLDIPEELRAHCARKLSVTMQIPSRNLDPKLHCTQCPVQLRNVSLDRPGAPFPAAAARAAQRAQQALPRVLSGDMDQLTVNEYAPGVGLSSHVDTHSAFTGAHPRCLRC